MKHAGKTSGDISFGWIIALSGGFSLGLSTGPMSMFGPLFMPLLSDDIKSGAVETIISVFVTIQFVAFFMGSYITKLFGIRSATLISALILSVGNVCSAFCVNYIQLLLSYGVLVGFGSGCMYIIATSCVNDHFTKFRTVAFGLLHTVNMTIATLLPLLINLLIENFGSQGSQLLLSAIAANTIPAALLFRPAKINRYHSEKLHLSERFLIEDGRDTGAVKLIEDEKTITSEKYIMSSSNSRTSTLQSWKRIFSGIAQSPLMLLFKRHDYIVLTLGLALTSLVEVFFFALFPLYLLNFLRISLEDTSYVMSAVGASDFAGRVFLMLAGRCLSNSNRLIYWITITMSGAIVMVITHVDNYNVILVSACILGMARGFLYVTSGLVFSEHYVKDLYSAAMGGLGLVSGIINFVVAYLFGLLQDYSGGYMIKFTAIVGIMFGISGVWLLETILNPDFRRILFRIRSK